MNRPDRTQPLDLDHDGWAVRAIATHYGLTPEELLAELDTTDPLDEDDHRDRYDRDGERRHLLPNGAWPPQEAHNRPQTAPDRAALADIAQAAHNLSQAICDLLDLKENQ